MRKTFKRFFKLFYFIEDEVRMSVGKNVKLLAFSPAGKFNEKIIIEEVKIQSTF